MLDYEQQYYSDDIQYIVGCDEAGRGCWLGPVVAGAVILPRDFKCDLINDSKQLNEKQREEAYIIIKKNAIAWAVAEVSAEEIDQINILKEYYPSSLKERFGIEEIIDVTQVLEAIALRRGLKKGDELDLLKAEIVLLKDFKDGKLGKITVERL